MINLINSTIKVLAWVVAIILLSAQALQAREIKYFDGTSVFFGLDVTNGTSNVCYDESWTGDIANSDKLTSNMGLYQNLVTSGRLNLQIRYTHHSCAINYDKPSYDAIGLIIEYRLF